MANRHCSLNFEGADCFRSHPIHLHRIFCFWFSKISNHQRRSSTMHFSVLRTKTIGATEILWIILNCILIVRLFVQSCPESLWPSWCGRSITEQKLIDHTNHFPMTRVDKFVQLEISRYECPDQQRKDQQRALWGEPNSQAKHIKTNKFIFKLFDSYRCEIIGFSPFSNSHCQFCLTILRMF